MAEEPDLALTHRIEAALTRIENAAGARAFATDRLTRRHARLRERMGQAVEALDALMARETSAADDR